MIARQPRRHWRAGLLLALAVAAALLRGGSVAAMAALTRTPTHTATPTHTNTPAPIGGCANGVCAYVTPGNHATATALVATMTAVASGSGGGSGGSSCGFLSIDPACILGGILEGIAASVDNVDQMFGNAGLWDSTSPALTVDNAAVQEYSGDMRLVADGLLLFFATAALWHILLSVFSGRTYAYLLDTLWNLALAGLMVNVSLDIIRWTLRISNELVLGISTVHTSDMAAIRGHHGLGGLLTFDLVGLLNAVMELLIGLQSSFRIGLVDVLVITAPLGLLCYGWHHALDWGRLWTRLFVATVAAQFLQTATLHLGDLLWTAPVSTNPLGEVAVAFGVLLVVFAIPRVLRGQTGSSGALMALAIRAALKK